MLQKYVILWFRGHMLNYNLAVVWQHFFITGRVHMDIYFFLSICILSIFQTTNKWRFSCVFFLTWLLVWSEFKYEFIGFASSLFTLISVNSKVFWCAYKISGTSLFFRTINHRFIKQWKQSIFLISLIKKLNFSMFS